MPLKLLELPVELPKMEQSMQWHAYRTNDPGLVWLRGQLQKAVLVMDNI